MQAKSLLSSTEIWLGIGLLGAGACVNVAGHSHDLLSQALAPFGAGLIISDLLARAAKASRERGSVRRRKED